MFRWFDSNQRMNDQGFIDSEPPQIFYTSIIISAQVKTTHFETRLRTECKTEFMLLQKTFFRKIVFKKWGAGLRPAASASACAPFLKNYFSEKCFLQKHELCFAFSSKSRFEMCGFDLCWNNYTRVKYLRRFWIDESLIIHSLIRIKPPEHHLQRMFS